MNNLFRQLNPTRQLPANIKDMISKFKTMSNPQAWVQSMLQKNPQINSLIQAANGDPEKAFRDLAKELNIDPEEIIRAMQG